MNKIEEAITEHWGERCPDHEPGCPTCDAWAEYDALTYDRAAVKELLIAATALIDTCVKQNITVRHFSTPSWDYLSYLQAVVSQYQNPKAKEKV